MLAILVKEKSNFGNSCTETQHFGDFGLEKVKMWHFFVKEKLARGIFDVEFSLVNGIIFTKLV